MTRRNAYVGAIAGLVLIAVAGAVTLTSRRDAAQPPAAAPTCESAEHRQFDFGVGEWEVTTPDGRVAGRNSITRELDDCVIHERWTGAGGGRGESFNLWDRDGRRWHQTWVNTRGELLLLDGAFEDGAMRMTGASGPPDRRVTNRITWTPAGDGTVRQLWEISADGGATWQTSFDGTYRRVEPASSAREPAG